MKTIAREDYTDNFFTLFKETFEGPPPQTASCYLDQNAGLLQTLEQVSAETASRSFQPGAPTIAAHCEHVRFYIVKLHELMHEPANKIDWKQSWLLHTVNPSEWETLKRELRRAYMAVTDELGSVESWGDIPIGHGMAILVHTAYHLGSIRQLMRALETQESGESTV
jgi:hypothetical protein